MTLTTVVLSGCSSSGGTGEDQVVVRTPPSVELVGYQKVLESASAKIKDTQQFENCLIPNINMCVKQVTNDLARSTNSIDLCDELPDVEGRDACRYGIVMSQIGEKDDISLCEKLTGIYATECVSSFYMAKALSSGDIAYCEKISPSTSSKTIPASPKLDQCRLDVIARSADATSADCDVFNNRDQKEACTLIVSRRLLSLYR